MRSRRVSRSEATIIGSAYEPRVSWPNVQGHWIGHYSKTHCGAKMITTCKWRFAAR
jgi:hypothetical protein